MKLSVVLGIIHMTWGILLRGANAIYFKQNVDLMFEFLPMIIFDLALFGWVPVNVWMDVCTGVGRGDGPEPTTHPHNALPLSARRLDRPTPQPHPP